MSTWVFIVEFPIELSYHGYQSSTKNSIIGWLFFDRIKNGASWIFNDLEQSWKVDIVLEHIHTAKA